MAETAESSVFFWFPMFSRVFFLCFLGIFLVGYIGVGLSEALSEGFWCLWFDGLQGS